MEIVGYLLSILMGVMLGLTGSGGTILTVPVLVYLFAVDTVTATVYSLFIVGFTATLGSVGYFRKGLVDLKIAILFALPSTLSVILTRTFVIAAIPDKIMETGNFILTKSTLLLLLFAILMIITAYSILKKAKPDPVEEYKVAHINYSMILLEGLIVGFITGLVGAGGGFLIIPSLVLFSKLSIKEAVGTSLVIIAANSLIGFLGEKEKLYFDWTLLLMVVSAAIAGVMIGVFLSKKIDSVKLKPAFGWFTLVMGIYIIARETILR